MNDLSGDEQDDFVPVPRLMDDDEFPDSDVSDGEDSVEVDEISFGDDEALDEDPGVEEEDIDEFDEENHSEQDGEDDDDLEEGSENAAVYYKPRVGEDIYGNLKTGNDGAAAGSKYVPPALRNKVSIIDEVESVLPFAILRSF